MASPLLLNLLHDVSNGPLQVYGNLYVDPFLCIPMEEKKSPVLKELREVDSRLEFNDLNLDPNEEWIHYWLKMIGKWLPMVKDEEEDVVKV